MAVTAYNCDMLMVEEEEPFFSARRRMQRMVGSIFLTFSLAHALDLEALAAGTYKDVGGLKGIEWHAHSGDAYDAYPWMPSLTMMSEGRGYVRVHGDAEPFGALAPQTEEARVQAIFVKDHAGAVVHFVKLAVGQQPITEFVVPADARELTPYAVSHSSRAGGPGLWQGGTLELADVDVDADAAGNVDADAIPEAPEPECPTDGGCPRLRANAKEEL